MPSVKMRRTTRVFGARVLRSGRRLLTGPFLEGKHHRRGVHAHEDEWIEILDRSNDGSGGGGGGRGGREVKKNKWHDNDGKNTNVVDNVVAPKLGVTAMDVESKIEKVMEHLENVVPRSSVEPRNVDKMWGKVYVRKRKRKDDSIVCWLNNHERIRMLEEEEGSDSWNQYLVSKKHRGMEVVDSLGSELGSIDQRLAVVVEFCSTSSGWLVGFLNSILRYLSRVRVKLKQLSMFLSSKPIAHVCSSHGVHFVQGSTSITSRGVCIIWGSKRLIPIFAVDFSAVPFCFSYIHTSLHLRYARLGCGVVPYLTDMDETDVRTPACEEQTSCIPVMKDLPEGTRVEGAIHDPPNNSVSNSPIQASELAGWNLHSVDVRSIQHQSTRSSLRPKRGRGRPPLAASARKANRALVSDSFRFRHDGVQRELRSSSRRSSATIIKEAGSSLTGLAREMDASKCSANILVTESDKCYREEGAVIMLEVSPSNQWFLVVKIDGRKRYSLTVQEPMRPCSCNRITHAIIWAAGDSHAWKLEFPNRQDWLVFKELYKKGAEHNMESPSPSMIPVPGVLEVAGYDARSDVSFVRPDMYISVKDDELARAFRKTTAIYDMDSEDEEWLNKFNSDSLAENLHLSMDDFELVVDALEKYFHCNPDDYSEEGPAVSSCVNIEKKAVEAVHKYWIRKRKQNRSGLVRIFQSYQPRKSQVLPKSVLRRKRSFKRQRSQVGRGKGKQRTFLQEMAAERDALEQQNAILKVREAKAAASRSEGLAVKKRMRAQTLMGNADLATYKATMALRIAEAARIARSTNAVAPYFLG